MSRVVAQRARLVRSVDVDAQGFHRHSHRRGQEASIDVENRAASSPPVSYHRHGVVAGGCVRAAPPRRRGRVVQGAYNTIRAAVALGQPCCTRRIARCRSMSVRSATSAASAMS